MHMLIPLMQTGQNHSAASVQSGKYGVIGETGDLPSPFVHVFGQLSNKDKSLEQRLDESHNKPQDQILADIIEEITQLIEQQMANRAPSDEMGMRENILGERVNNSAPRAESDKQDLIKQVLTWFMNKDLLPEQTEFAALLEGGVSAGQWRTVLTAFAQALFTLSPRQEGPQSEQLIERITHLIEHQGANQASSNERGMAERQQILSEFASWVRQLPESDKQHVIKQVLTRLTGMNAETEGHVTLFQNTNTGHPLQNSEKAPSNLNYLDVAALPKSRAMTNSTRILETHVPTVETLVGGGASEELVEVLNQRSEGTFNTLSLTSSSVTNTFEPRAVARPMMWLSHDFTETLRQHVVRHLQINPGGVSQARISLYPENLGQVDVRISSHNGVLTAHLVADTWIAKELLDGQLDHLRQALQNQGLQVNKLEVSIGQQGLPFKHFHHPYDPYGQEGNRLFKQEQSDPLLNVTESYTESDTSQVELWRNPHASVNYTV